MANDGWETISPSSTPSTANKDSGWETIVPNSTRPEMEHRDPFAYARKAAHAGVRAAGEGVAPGLAGLAGASAGAAAMAVPAGYAAALSGPAGPIIGSALELLGAGVGAFVGSEGMASIQDKLHQLIAPEDYEMRKQQKKDFPIETTIGNIAGSSVGLSPKAAFDPAAKFINTANKARVASGVAQGAISAGTQYATNNEISPVDTALAVATGVALPGVNKIGKPAAALGHMVGGVFNPKPKAPGKEPPPQVPPEGSPPEVIEEFKKQLKERAKLTQTAIRDKATGEIELMGPKHDEARKAETKDTHDQGFVDQLGNFYDRKEALDKAIKTGMIPKDHPLEFPDEGLHSGDLRKAGVKAFEVAPEAPKAPVTREEHKSRIKELDDQLQSLETVDIPNAEHTKDPALESLRKQAESIQNEMDSLHKSIPEVQFKDKLKPTWDEFQDLTWGSHTYGEAIDKALAAGIGGRGHKILLELLGRSEYVRSAGYETTTESLPWTDKHGVTKNNAVGLYHPFNPNDGTGHRVSMGKEGSLNTFLHEGIHSATHALIEAGNHPAAIELKKLYETNNAIAEKEYEVKLDKYKKYNPNATMKDLENFRNNNFEYGFESVHEFITEAFVKDSFREWLSTKPADPNKPVNKLNNLWVQFKSLIANSMGLKDRTLLDEVLDAGIELIDKSSEKGFKAPGTSTAPISSPQEGVTKNIDYYRSSPASTKEGEFLKEVEEKASPSVAKAAEKVDPRSIPFDREEDFYNHAINIHTLYGEEAAIKFFEDWNAYKKEQAIPIPTDNKGLDDSLHIMDTLQTRDKSEHVTSYTKNAKEEGITEEMQKDAFDKTERGESVLGKLGEILKNIWEENLALVRKAKALGLDVGEEFESGQSRIRIYGGVTTSWKKMISELFANRTPLGEKVADQANAAIERKVYGIEGTDRVIEIHRVAEDKTVNYRKTRKENGKEVPYGPWITRDMKRGTEFWEWRDGKKSLVGHSDDINFKLGQEFKDKTGEMRKMSTAKVPDIEAHSHYRYLHNAEISARLANMGLRKMVRDAEFLQGLMKSEMFKTVGHSPEQDLKTLPKGWRVPDNIDRIPQLRGWHFDPKTAAIIEDFAKVWDNTMWMKMTNQVVKNLMLNPLPHMFNEVMHLWNARGFSGWVPLTGGLSRLSRTGKAAWESVGKQDAFFREVLREGGSPLSADPRNNVFDQIILKAGKKLNDDPPTKNAIASLAKKMGTSVGDFYNSWSKASQKAMWFTRDVMYMQYLMEVKELHQKRTGQEMSTKEAIEETEKHMPNYRMPSEVLNSRSLAKVLKNPNITMFSRYHYGMVKSLVNTLKDVDPRNLKSPEGRQHFKDGVDTLMAIGVAMGALYPLMNWMAEQMFGEGAEQRQAGPYHLLHAGVQVAKGERDASALIWPMLSFNPMLLTLGQLAFNKKIFTGKQIYHPEDSIPDIAKDIGSYGVKQIPQAPPIMGAISEEGGAAVTLARQLDIQAKTPEQKARIDRAKKREERSAKARKTKREKGTYTP